MNVTAYIICQILVILVTFFLTAFTTYGLRRAYLSMKKEVDRQNQIIQWVFYGMLFWLLILTALSVMGFYENFEALPPRILLFAVVPPILLVVFLLFSKQFSLVLQHIPPQWLIQIQSFRVIVEIMLWIGFMGHFVPFQMTFEGFNMDIIAGLTAYLAGQLFFGNGRFLRSESVIWNIFGLFLLLNIVFIAIISTPSPFQVFNNEPTNTFIAHFPFIWILGFTVPFALAMHLFSLKQVLVLMRK